MTGPDLELPRPFPSTPPAIRQPMPGRPWIVRAYVAVVVVTIPYDIAWMATHDRLSAFGTVWSLGATAVSALLIWSASRTGWIVLAAWAVVSIPFVLTASGGWLYAVVTLHVIALAILFNPWMLRWVWRDGRPTSSGVERRPE